jgi:two-component system, sensor histidine kinase and response regulator
VDVAGNGLEVLSRLKQHAYDVILMDVQMPEMDGFEATASIRALESSLGKRTPIIAMTAHTAQEDYERCLKADMDAYLAKPIDVRRLIELVEGIAAGLAETFRHKGNPQHLETGDPLDSGNVNGRPFSLNHALQRLAGNHKLLQTISEAFRDEATILIAELRQALGEANCERVHRAAHSLGGLAAAFDAKDAIVAARRVEQSGRAGDLNVAAEAALDLERHVERLKEALADHFASCG